MCWMKVSSNETNQNWLLPLKINIKEISQTKKKEPAGEDEGKDDARKKNENKYEKEDDEEIRLRSKLLETSIENLGGE